MIGAFRQPLGIPDAILPDAWRRAVDEDEQIDKEFKTIHDPCAIYEYDDSTIYNDELDDINNEHTKPSRGRKHRQF